MSANPNQYLSLLRLSDAVGMDDPEMDNAFDALFSREQDILS